MKKKSPELSEFVFLSISDTATIESSDYMLPNRNKPLKMAKIEAVWDEKTCPHCKAGGTLHFLHAQGVDTRDRHWESSSNEYRCGACHKYILYTQRRKIYRNDENSYLAASPLGPVDSSSKEKGWRLPKIDGYSLMKCSYCYSDRVKHLSGSSGGAPTGRTSFTAVLYCQSCHLYWYAAEFND